MPLGRRVVIRAVEPRTARDVVVAHEAGDELPPASRLAPHVHGHACIAFLATHLVDIARRHNGPV